MNSVPLKTKTHNLILKIIVIVSSSKKLLVLLKYTVEYN